MLGMDQWHSCIEKIRPTPEAVKRCKAWHAQGFEIVFTNGCFDLIHDGHLQYLAQARGLGNRLVVGLNTDASVRRLKGKTRPIIPEQSRARLLAALQFVDLVVLFDEDTPLHLIEALNPDVLVKGGDYAIDQIIGADWVAEHGGFITTLPMVAGQSTTAIIERIKKS
jgi:D-glycero-beta-D-manno-heptose 1-phosphate adenylyltransferase